MAIHCSHGGLIYVRFWPKAAARLLNSLEAAFDPKRTFVNQAFRQEFTMAIPADEFWGSNYYENPPLTDDAISGAESQLGVILPDEYVRLLRKQNGGYTKRFAFPMTQRTSWAEDHVPLDAMAGIVTDLQHAGVHSILQTEYMTKEWGLPPRQVLLHGDGHWWITLDYRESDSPSVAWIDAEIGEDIQIASSFPVFLDGLVPASVFDIDDA